MALTYEWESFIRLHGGEAGARDMFEKTIDALLRAENPGKEVHTVGGVMGDGGIDVYVHQGDGIDIYQCKFFMGSMTPGRWSQIRESFDRAMEPKGVKVLRWVLCMPREMQKEDIGKWDEFKKDRASYGVEIQLVDGNEIVARMRECDRRIGTDLMERYFGQSIGERKGINVLPKCLTNYIPMHPEFDLIGRDDVVIKAISILESEKMLALIGIGGIGKTAVMQKVCDQIVTDDNAENHVAWITCGESLEDNLLVLRDSLGVPKGYNRKEAYSAVIQGLRTIPGKLYLFLDDMTGVLGYKDLGLLNTLRPNVLIMITTRMMLKQIPYIELKELDNNSALEMFYGYYGRNIEQKYIQDVEEIIDLVNRNTLLIELLAKSAKRSFDTLDVFRKKLERKGFFEVSQARIDGLHDENRTIEESVMRLYDISGLSDEQKKIMRLFSIFTPEKSIYGKVVEWAGLDEDYVEELVKLGWLSRTEGGYVIHQIVKDSIARQVGESLRIEDFGSLISKVADTDSYMPVELEYTKIRERLVLAEDVARYVERRTGSLLKIEERSEQDVSFLKDCSTLFNNMANVYLAQGDYAKALEYNDKALEIRERVLGSGHPDTAATYDNIAGVYYAQGDYAKALEYYEKALEIKVRVLGSGHPYTAATYNNIALVYSDQGDYAKALEYYEKALEIRERVLGSGHPYTAATYDNMAGVYSDQGEYAKALEYNEKAIEISERVLGSNHPSTATTYNNIAGVYREQGEYARALEYYEKALEIRERVLGSDHPDTATMYNNIADVLREQGEYAKALEYNEKALVIREQVLGNGHPDTATTYNNVADVYREQGDYAKALEYYYKALEIRERVLGSDHPDTAMTYSNVADVLREQGEYAKALEYNEKALEIRERVLGIDHPYTAVTYNNMALVYSSQGEYAKALEYYEKNLRIIGRVLGINHPYTASTYNNIALVYSSQGDYAKALEYYKKALEIRERVLGSRHPDTAATYNNIALVYSSQGDYAKALEYYKKALEIREKVLGTNHPDTAETYNNLGLIYSELGDSKKALEFYSKALSIQKNVLGAEHPDTSTTYVNIASIYRSLGENEKALELYNKALSISEYVLGKENPDTIAIKTTIASLSVAISDSHKGIGDQNSIQTIDQSNVDHIITIYHKKLLAILTLFPKYNCSKALLQNLFDENKSKYEDIIYELSQMGWVTEESGIVFATPNFVATGRSTIELDLVESIDFYRDLLNKYMALPINQLFQHTDLLSIILSRLPYDNTSVELLASVICDKSSATDMFYRNYPECEAACIYIDSRNFKRTFYFFDLIKHETTSIESIGIKTSDDVISLIKVFSKKKFTMDFSMIDSEKRIIEIPNSFCCNNQSLTTLVLPVNISRIGTKAFYGCSYLQGNLELPNSLIEIDTEAFYGCISLSGDIRLPDNMEVIRERAFAGCRKLSGNIYLSKRLKEIKDDAFNYQYVLSNGTANITDHEESKENRIDQRGKIFFPDDITHIKNNSYKGFTGLFGELQFNERIISIGDWAFEGCIGLSGDLVFHNSLERIGNHAFDGCSGLSGKVVFGNKLSVIESYAFRKCVNLTGKLDLPETLNELGEYAFGECSSLTGDIKIPETITALSDDVFNGCKGLTNITFSSNLKKIGDRAFCDCVGLMSKLQFPVSLTIIGDEAFMNCKSLSGELHLNENISFIGDRAFLGCESLSGELSIPQSIFSLGADAFSGCTGLDNVRGWTVYSSREYFKELLKEDPVPLNECKVVLLGAGGAGKSLAIRRILKDGDIVNDFDGESTPGIQISHHNEMIGNNNYLIHYWDFGGQEILYSMHRVFMSQRTLYVVFVNARDNLQDESAHNWLHDISIYAPGSPVLLVINQIDQNPAASINEKRLHEMYPQLRNTIKLSALKYSKEEFNNTLIKSIHSLIDEVPGVRIPFPATWKSLLRCVNECHDKYIDLAKFRQFCQDNSIPGYEDVRKILIDKIQDLGIGFFYKRKIQDEFVMLLEPEWIINAIYIILFNGAEYAENGVISHKVLYKLLREKKLDKKIIKKIDKEQSYKKGEVDYILSVLRDYKLSYKKEKGIEFLPMLCNRNQKITTKEEFDSEAIHMIFRYTYKPVDVFHRLIVEMHRDLVSDQVWYSGAILKNEQKQLTALVYVTRNDLHFQIRSNSNDSYENEYAMILHDQISSINLLLRVSAEELVAYHADGKCAEFFYDDLIGSKTNDIAYIYSRIHKRGLEVKEILRFSDSEFIECHKNLLHKMLEALQRLQNNRMYFSRKENDRNTFVRDLLEMCNYTCKDQTLRGVSESESEAGELDILIEKTEGSDDRQLRIVTVYEALILRSFNDSDKRNVNKHLKKLLKNYNQIGCPILYLVTYAEWKAEEFEKNSQLYFNFVQEGLDSIFSVSSIGQEVKKGQYMCYRKITYDCGGIPFSVYHILVRIEDSSEEELKKSILKLATERTRIGKEDVAKSFMISSDKASRVLKTLCNDGMLVSKKENRQTIYCSCITA